MRIGLRFQTKIDPEATLAGLPLRLIRLMAQVRLATREGWSRSRRAIVDTGNPVSIIPHSAWRELALPPAPGLRRRLRGIGTSDQTAVSGTLSRVRILLHDEQNASEPVEMRAFLLDNDAAPLLIGFEDILTRAVLHCDYASGVAYLDL
jgi:hypothetical protein